MCTPDLTPCCFLESQTPTTYRTFEAIIKKHIVNLFYSINHYRYHQNNEMQNTRFLRIGYEEEFNLRFLFSWHVFRMSKMSREIISFLGFQDSRLKIVVSC